MLFMKNKIFKKTANLKYFEIKKSVPESENMI